MKQLILYFLFSIITIPVFSQQQIEDSLVQTLDTASTVEGRFYTLLKISRYTMRYSLDKSREYLKQATSIANEQLNEEWLAEINMLLGRIEATEGNYDIALKLFEDALAIYEETGDVFNIYACINGLGIINRRKGNFIGAVNILEKAKLYFDREEITDENKSNVLNNLSNAYSQINLYPKAIEALYEGLSYCEKAGDQQGLGLGYGNLGLIYQKQKKYKQAIENLEKSLAILKEENDLLGQMNALTNLGAIYDAQGDFKKELELRQAELELAEKLGSEERIWSAKIGLGGLHISLEEYDKAEAMLNELSVEAVQDNLRYLFTYYKTYSYLYSKQKKHQKAIEYANKAFSLAQEMGDNDQMASALNALHHVNYESNQLDEAYQYLLQYQEVKDSLVNANNVEELTTQKLQFEFNKEQEVLELEKEALESKVRVEELTRWGLLALLLLVGIIAFLVYRYYRKENKLLAQDLENKKVIEAQAQQLQQFNDELEQTVSERTKELEQANYELRTFNYIASHDIKEPIRNIGNYAGLIFRKLPNELKKDFEDYFNTIKNSSNQLYTLVEDFSKYTQFSQDKNVEMQPVDLNELVENLTFSLNAVIQDKNGKVINEGLPIIQSSSSLMFTILKNIVENGLKHNTSEIPTVLLSATEHEDFHQIHIKDNGIGIQEEYRDQIFGMFKRLHARSEQQGSGIGLAIVKLLTDKLGVTIDLESEPNNGSTLVLSIPK